MKKNCNEAEKKCSKAEHEKKPAHTNKIPFKGTEEKKECILNHNAKCLFSGKSWCFKIYSPW